MSAGKELSNGDPPCIHHPPGQEENDYLINISRNTTALRGECVDTACVCVFVQITS